ncbi:EAL domain-containing protein [Vibrio cincinnatiensis]|uniref:EAL domain-containing protein n=1 Tax=Vibrio cincinnatiensis TaxID=675 RepID=UPI0038AD9BB1
MNKELSKIFKYLLFIVTIPVPLVLLVSFIIFCYESRENTQLISHAYLNNLEAILDDIYATNDKILISDGRCDTFKKKILFDGFQREFIIIKNDKVLCSTINDIDESIVIELVPKNYKNHNVVEYKNSNNKKVLGFVSSSVDGLFSVISVVNANYLKMILGSYSDDRIESIAISSSNKTIHIFGPKTMWEEVSLASKYMLSSKNRWEEVSVPSKRYNFVLTLYVGEAYFHNLYIRCLLFSLIITLLLSFFYIMMKYLFPSRSDLLKDLNKAIDQKELYLVYHSLASSKDGYIIGYESLIRWMHPKLGVIRPDHFIPVAEKYGLINKITNYVFELAYKEWLTIDRDISAGFLLGINIPSDYLLDESCIAVIKEYAKKFAELNIGLVLEMTENQTICSEKMKALNKLIDEKIMVAIDDFGTGQTSLSMLQNSRFDFLKIDKVFVDAIESEYMNTHVLDSIIQLSHDLGVIVVAEGVETKKQYEYLQSKGVEVQQGYYLSMPQEIYDIYPQSNVA